MVTDAHFWGRRANFESWVRRNIATTVCTADAEYIMEDLLGHDVVVPRQNCCCLINSKL